MLLEVDVCSQDFQVVFIFYYWLAYCEAGAQRHYARVVRECRNRCAAR